MDELTALDIVREAIWLIIKVSAPLLLVSLVVGLIISVFQTVTSIQEQTLTFVPKLLAIFLIMMLFGSWIMGSMVEFLTTICKNLIDYI